MYRIYNCKNASNEVLKDLMEDDIVGRLSIDHMEASLISKNLVGMIIVLEGAEDALRRSEELVGGKCDLLTGKEAEDVYGAVKEQMNKAESGMGFFFD